LCPGTTDPLSSGDGNHVRQTAREAAPPENPDFLSDSEVHIPAEVLNDFRINPIEKKLSFNAKSFVIWLDRDRLKIVLAE
jgi:hypothetical protein